MAYADFTVAGVARKLAFDLIEARHKVEASDEFVGGHKVMLEMAGIIVTLTGKWLRLADKVDDPDNRSTPPPDGWGIVLTNVEEDHLRWIIHMTYARVENALRKVGQEAAADQVDQT